MEKKKDSCDGKVGNRNYHSPYEPRLAQNYRFHVVLLRDLKEIEAKAWHHTRKASPEIVIIKNSSWLQGAR